MSQTLNVGAVKGQLAQGLADSGGTPKSDLAKPVESGSVDKQPADVDLKESNPKVGKQMALADNPQQKGVGEPPRTNICEQFKRMESAQNERDSRPTEDPFRKPIAAYLDQPGPIEDEIRRLQLDKRDGKQIDEGRLAQLKQDRHDISLEIGLLAWKRTELLDGKH